MQKDKNRHIRQFIQSDIGFILPSLLGVLLFTLLPLLDVIVDGEFIEERKNLRLAFRGSENQRILDVQLSLKENCGKLLAV